jgi:uncharacterized protein YllA (UPF0747 family)
MPALVPRGSITLIESGIQKNTSKYNVKFESILTKKENFIEESVKLSMVKDSEDAFQKFRERLDSPWKDLEKYVEQIDPTLREAAKNSFSKIQYQIDSLKSKAVHAEEKKNSSMVQQLGKISDYVYPEEKYQERFYNIVQYLNRYGWDFINTIYENIDIDNLGKHQVLYL